MFTLKHKSPNTSRYLQKQKQMLDAAQEFVSGTLTIQETMAKYNVCYASIYTAIKRFGLTYKYTYGRTVFFNEDYFDIIDNEHKAYWLGFLFADGSLSKSDPKVSGYNRLSLSLSDKDLCHVQAFATAIEMPSDQVKISHNYKDINNIAYVHCNSLKMCNNLIRLGYTIYKTNRQHIPQINDNYINHFIRGYFDADGCVWGTFSNGAFEICSSSPILLEIKQKLIDSCNLPNNKVYYCKNSITIKWGGRIQALKIFRYLYDNATIYLERKHQKFVNRCFRSELDYISSLDGSPCTSI